MRKGIYLVIIVESIDRNGIGINPIRCKDIAECDYPQFKKSIEREGWQIYCRSTSSSSLNDQDLIEFNDQDLIESQF